MTGVMGEILEHYGQTVTLRSRDGEKSIRAFIQPAAARDETVPGEQTPIALSDEINQWWALLEPERRAAE